MKVSAKKISAAVASCALAAGLMFTMSPASAAAISAQPAQINSAEVQAKFEAADLAYIKNSFKNLQIPADKQEALLQKIATGKQLDSETGKKPVKIDTVTNTDGSQTVTSRWADGSATSTSEFPDKGPLAPSSSGGFPVASPASVTGCTNKYEVGMTHKNGCKIWHQAVTWSAGFTSSFRYSLSNGNYIKSISNPMTGGIGMGSGKLSYIKRSALSSQTAKAQLKARQKVNIGPIPTSRDVGVILNVSRAGGSTSSFGA